MKIKIISIGKIKEQYLQVGINEFSKRLGRFCTLEFIILKDSTPQKETQEILNKLNNEYIVVLDIYGKQFSSIELSEFLKKINKNMVFIIGSDIGLSEEIKKRADLKLSLSKMTFLHEMTQLILLEQIYRAFSIMKNAGYHK
jgi:23S rRNA (pseudouridine1915-N3)-methyltransferase